MFYRMNSLILALATAILISSCGKSDGDTVGRVGSYDISAGEFNDFFAQFDRPFPTAQAEIDQRRQSLDSLVLYRLLIQGAYEKGIDQSEELARLVLANKEQFLLQALYDTEILSQADPTEAEIRDFYNKLENKIRTYHLLVGSEDSALAIRSRLDSGENFEQLAYDLSIDRTAKRNRGDLGYIVWGSMVPEFQKVAFGLEVGQVSDPVESQFGFHIIKVIDRLPNLQRTSFGTMKAEIYRTILGVKSKQLTTDYFQQLQEKYSVRTDTATCQYLVHKREALYPPLLLETLPAGDFDVEQLDRDEKELVLASWDGGQITVMQYLVQVKNWPVDNKPAFDDYKGISETVFALKRLEILALEAYRLGIDNDPGFLRKLKLFRELNMASMMRSDSIELPPPPKESDVRAYFDEHPDEFINKAKVHIFEILVSDELQANKMKSTTRALEDFRSKATDLTERPGKRASGGDLGYIERIWFPDLFDLAMKTSVGAIGGPVQSNGKFSIFYVADKLEEEPQDFLGVKNRIERRMIRQQKEDAIKNWLDDRYQSTDISIDEEALLATIDMNKYSTEGAQAP